MRLLFVSLLFCLGTACAGREFTVLVYNVENLTSAGGRSRSDDYRPLQYSRAHLLTKLTNIARVAARLDDGSGPDIILFQEIERDISTSQYAFDHEGMIKHFADTRIELMLGRNYDREISHLPVEALLLKTFYDHGMRGYHAVAADDGMAAGPRKKVNFLNVAFSRFPIQFTATYPQEDAPATLELQVSVDGWPLYLFVNHWTPNPSDPRAENKRIKASDTLRARLDEIIALQPSADIIVAGDFNCPFDQQARYRWRTTAINDVLHVYTDNSILRSDPGALYNLWSDDCAEAPGSELYQGQWTTFMQIILSSGLYDYRGIQCLDRSFRVAAFPDLNAKPTGEPYAWSFKGKGAGFSTHFPVYARFKTVRENHSDVFLKTEPSTRKKDPPSPTPTP